MAEKNFAFESGKVSIAFRSERGLGDAVVAKKVFDALIELAPDCVIDIFYREKGQRAFAESFFSDSKNLNSIVDFRISMENHFFARYDLLISVFGTHAVLLDILNPQRLQKLSPKLFFAANKIKEYYKANVKDFKPISFTVPLRNVAISRTLQKNFFHFLSCGGALPIRDEKINIPLAPEVEPVFESLKLGKYITIYSNIGRDGVRPKVKTWPMKYLVEYVSRVKKNFPALEIIQVGGDDAPIENVDRKFLGCDLELTKYILANSLLHVGCEGGLIHLATALGTKCLVLFGSSDWHYFSYKQNINVTAGVCEPCMYILENFSCLRSEFEPPCMTAITPVEIFEFMCDFLKNNS